MRRARRNLLSRLGWPVAGIVLWMLALEPVGVFEPWIAPKLGRWIEVLPFFLAGGLACFIAGFIEGAFRRKDVLLAAAAVLLPAGHIGLYRVFDLESLRKDQWTAFFHRHKAEWKEAEQWFKTLGESERRVPPDQMPSNLRQFAQAGYFRVRMDQQGTYWYAFCMVSMGIDNDRVFLWSREGGPPPDEAYPVIVKAWPMGGGWYFANTT